MKTLYMFLGTASLSVLAAVQPAMGATLFTAEANVENEVCSNLSQPCPTESNATAKFTAELNDAEDALTYRFVINGLDLGYPTGQPQTPDTGDDVFKVHIHSAPPGVAGPVVFSTLDLTMTMTSNDADDVMFFAPQGIVGGTVTGVWEQTDGPGGANGTTLQDQLQNLKDGNLYVNIHSNRFLTNGEIRGQVTAVPEPASALGVLAFSALGAGSLLKRQQKKM